MRILFVCLGNICRSPTAEGVLLKLLADAGLTHVEVDSCGTGHWHVDDPPDARTIRHAAQRGYDLSPLRARVLASDDFARFDRIYAMDRQNLRELKRRAPPAHQHKLTLLLDVVAPGEEREVPDPYVGGAEGFEEVLDLVEEAARAIVAELRAAR